MDGGVGLAGKSLFGQWAQTRPYGLYPLTFTLL